MDLQGLALAHRDPLGSGQELPPFKGEGEEVSHLSTGTPGQLEWPSPRGESVMGDIGTRVAPVPDLCALAGSDTISFQREELDHAFREQNHPDREHRQRC